MPLIQDQLFYADGGPVLGALQISSDGFLSPRGREIWPGVVEVAISSGGFQVTLESSGLAVYRVRLLGAGAGGARDQRWRVPDSEAVLRVADVRLEEAVPPLGGVQFADGEAPGGELDGVNRLYTLAHVVWPVGSLILVRNGLLQSQGEDYALDGARVEFLEAVPPLQADDLLRAWYRYRY